MKKIEITTEFIKLDQLLKFANIAESGACAKEMIAATTSDIKSGAFFLFSPVARKISYTAAIESKAVAASVTNGYFDKKTIAYTAITMKRPVKVLMNTFFISNFFS